MRALRAPNEGGVQEHDGLFDSTGKLLAAIKQGDSSVGQALYARFADRLFDLALSCTHDNDVAAALVADVIVEASHSCPNTDSFTLSVWMYRLLREHLSNWIGTRIASDDRVVHLPEHDVTDPICRGHLMWTALEGATERDQLMANLRLRHGINAADQAAILGISSASNELLWETTSAALRTQLSALMALSWQRSHPEHPIPALSPLYDLALAWDGDFTPLVHREAAQRIADHPEAMEWVKTNLDDPLNSFASVPLTPAPAGLQVVVIERLNMAEQLRASASEQGMKPVEIAVDDDDATIPPGAWPGGPIEAPDASTKRKSRKRTRQSRRTLAVVSALGGLAVGVAATLSAQTVLGPTRLTESAIAESSASTSGQGVASPSAQAGLPGRLTVPSGVLPVESGTSTSMLLANTGGTALDWHIKQLPDWVETRPSSGSLAPGTTVEVALTLGTVSDSTDQSGQIDIAWGGVETGVSSVRVQSHAGLPPQVGELTISPQPQSCSQPLTVSLPVEDSAGVREVTVTGHN
ncbi:hypothetical protein, partial [Stomatohabitans albus]